MLLAQGQYTIKRLPTGGNLLKWQDEWKLGNGSIPGWSNNGLSAENIRVMGANPFGIQTMLWKCVPDATTTDNGGAAGGWNTSTRVLDKNYAYRYCVFVYKNKTGGTTFHGCQGANNLDGTANGNPYFWSNTLTPGQWFLMVGIIHPSSVTVQSGISGVYDMTGKKIASGVDFKFRTDGTNAYFRSYLYYSYDTTVNQWFYNPMLYKLDGTEPSIEQILQVSVRSEVDLVKSYSTTQIEQLNKSISLKAETSTVNALTGRVSTAEGNISVMAGQISSKVSATDFNGNKIASLITQTPAAVSVLAQNILVSGAVTFSMFSSDAQNKISTAQSTANAAVNNLSSLQNSLGAMAYQSMVSLAKLDTTIVEGGLIKTSLINADAIITNQLLANKIAATDITTNRLTVTAGGKIGDFTVTNGLSYNNGSDYLSIGPMNVQTVAYDPYVDKFSTLVNVMQYSKSDMTNSLNRSNFIIGKTAHLGRAAYTKRGTTMSSADAMSPTVIVDGGLFVDRISIDIDYGYQEITDINQLKNVTTSSPRRSIIGLKLTTASYITWDFLNAITGDNMFGTVYTFVNVGGQPCSIQIEEGAGHCSLDKGCKSATLMSLRSFKNQTERRWVPLTIADWW